MQYSIKWPPDFESISWQIESRGWLSGVEIMVEEKTLRPVFYDPVRLAQDIADDVSRSGIFVEPCLIVIDRVTPQMIESAIANLAKTEGLKRLM